MNKKYIITNEQYRLLKESKKTAKIVNEILEHIETSKKNLNESVMLNEAIVDTLKKYWRKGLLTTAVMASLLANNVNAADLSSAGVPKNKIETAKIDVVKLIKDKLGNLNISDAQNNTESLIDMAITLANHHKLDANEKNIKAILSAASALSKQSQNSPKPRSISDYLDLNDRVDFLNSISTIKRAKMLGLTSAPNFYDTGL